MFSHQLKKKFSHFFTSEVGSVSPEQIVRAGLTFSAAAGALSVLAGSAEGAPCSPCPTKSCSDPVAGNWSCPEKCRAHIGGQWRVLCQPKTCVVIGDDEQACQS